MNIPYRTQQTLKRIALGILPVYFYREEEEETEIPLLVYAVYPAALAAFGLVSIFL